MASDKRKEFLNLGILGSDAGVPERRNFRAIKTDYVGSPDYNARFFETFPTAWASAYAFRKALAAEKQTDEGAVAFDDALTLAKTEEWICIFLLHYWGVIKLVEYKQDELMADYDHDLWMALSGTYPSSRAGNLAAVYLLETNEATVVSAYYPEVMFFPSRNRELWSRDKALSGLLDKTQQLSWEQCRKSLLTNEKKASEFHAHLLRIAQLLPSPIFKARVAAFCKQHLTGDVELSGTLDPEPMKWEIPGNMPPSVEELLTRYPLRKANRGGGFTYFLVSGMPQLMPWMTAATLSGCSPIDYRKTGDLEITVRFGKKQIPCKLDDKDGIILLKDLFLSESPYWCKVPRANDFYTTRLRSLHRIELRDPMLRQEEFALCLAPITREFLEHFPQVFENLKGLTATPDLQRPKVDWTLPILGYEVRWQTSPVGQSEMPNTTLAIWPPRVSEKWRLYVAYGTGNKDTSGRWHLIDEQGSQGYPVELGTDEYVSVLQRPGTANRPKAMLFTDNNDKERGVLFLSDFPEQTVDSGQQGAASLAVDFGTSNTCLAFKREGRAEILKFKLSPEMLWGELSKVENPGFVPFKWAGSKGFFPTILLSRRSAAQLEELKPEEIQVEHLFKVDIPGLHRDIEEGLAGGFKDWETHFNMKWDLGIQAPWRSLFLGLTLLYAHAERFFAGVQGLKFDRYLFTFPLAFSDTDRQSFHDEARKTISKIRQFCYGTDPASDVFQYEDKIDESTAIAKAARKPASASRLDIFVDVGGGTADIAIRNGERFLVLDSIKVAGNTFFHFAKRNFNEDLVGAAQFRKHLGRMLLDSRNEFSATDFDLDFGILYSALINRHDDNKFRQLEGKVLKDGMGVSSFQRYRTKLLFRHVIAYALLQACAAVAAEDLTLEDGITLILGGNAWGLMMFAEFGRRSDQFIAEAAGILRLLQKQMAESVPAEKQPYLAALKITGIELLNENDLSQAKTDVAVGALLADGSARTGKGGARPYAGITLRGLKINEFDPATIAWYDRWGFEELVQKFGPMDKIRSLTFEQPKGLGKPLDPALSIFTCLGNTSSNNVDNMPEATWRDMNGELCAQVTSTEGNRLAVTPINFFMSQILYPEDEQRDFLDILAEENGDFKSDRK